MFSMKILLSIIVTVIYLLFSLISFIGIENISPVTLIRHCVLVTGFIPWCFWMYSINIEKSSRIRLHLIAVVVTISHILVYAVSAHNDGLAYWSIQFIEISFIYYLINRYMNLEN